MQPHKTEPVALVATIAVILVSLAAIFNVTLSTDTIETIIVNLIIVIGAIDARSQVVPKHKVLARKAKKA